MPALPRTMRGVWLTGHGGPDRLELRDDIPVPQPAENEVLIRVTAAGVNNTDINTRIGWYTRDDAGGDTAWSGSPIDFPRIQGADACGRIVAVGDRIDERRIGERVLVEPCLREVNGKSVSPPWYFGSECDGGFAEYTVVSNRHAHRVDSPLSDVELASFPCSYSTAENMLTRSNVTAGDTVLVTGASGGVGSAAVQLALARGAEVMAVTSAPKADDMLALGAVKTIEREESVVSALGENSVDAVIDLVGGNRWHELMDVLRPGGRLAVSGAIAGPSVNIDLRVLYLKDLRLLGCTMLEPEVFANLVDRIEKGHIAPLVAHTFPLEDIVHAQETFLGKKHIGKIVLTLG